MEYSQNRGGGLPLTRGTTLGAVFQGLIDRTRRHLDVPKLRTIFGYKTCPHHRQNKKPLRVARVRDQPAYDLTVLKVHFGPLALKL